MATEKSSRSARPRARSSDNQTRTHPPVAVSTTECIPAKKGEILIREMRRLQKALAVLTCMREAALYQVDVDFADVAAVACDLVDKALYELDLAEVMKDPDKSAAQLLALWPVRKRKARQ